MDWWKEFPGWLITTLLAFLAFAVVAWQEIRRSVLLPRAEWEGSLVHAPVAIGAGDHYFLLKNRGNLDAHGVMVLAYHCTIPGDNPGALFDRIEIMGSERVVLESVNEASYVIISWRSQHHRARSLSTWLPVEEETELASRHWEQKTWPWFKTFWAMLRHPHAVGPGTALHGSLPSSPRKLVQVTKKLKRKSTSDS